MVQSNHFGPELARVLRDQLDGVLPCVPGVQGTFDLTAEARYACIVHSLETPQSFFQLLRHRLISWQMFEITDVQGI